MVCRESAGGRPAEAGEVVALLPTMAAPRGPDLIAWCARPSSSSGRCFARFKRTGGTARARAAGPRRSVMLEGGRLPHGAGGRGGHAAGFRRAHDPARHPGDRTARPAPRLERDRRHAAPGRVMAEAHGGVAERVEDTPRLTALGAASVLHSPSVHFAALATPALHDDLHAPHAQERPLEVLVQPALTRLDDEQVGDIGKRLRGQRGQNVLEMPAADRVR